jgi:hypothetical protein
MGNELTNIDQSTDFLCPSCGASAFEVMGTQWDSENGATQDGGELLVMRCLDCLHLFCHRLEVEPSGVVAREPSGIACEDGAEQAPLE